MKLFNNFIYNLLGLGLPLVVAVFTIPMLISGLGEVRFGLLTLIWAVVSYFGLFDLGLGRALTQQLTVVFANHEEEKSKPLVFTACLLMGSLGVLAGVLLIVTASWGIGLIHDVPDRQETINALYAMGVAMPFIVLTSGLRGVLEARHAFGIVNLIRLPMGMFTFLGPLAVVLYSSPHLDLIAWVLVAGRIAACLVHGYYANRILPQEGGTFSWHSGFVKPLCISGGWMTVSNIISPLMGYLDRFMVGAVASAQAVAHYATPQELISKLSIVPSALVTVLFPQFAQMNSRSNSATVEILERTSSLITALCVPIFTLIGLFSHDILSTWINSQFADSASLILALMACGMLVNSIALIPMTWLQATNHSKNVALIHLTELPLFCFLLWFVLQKWGAHGAAIAWVIRILIDACLLWLSLGFLESQLLKICRKYLFQSIVLACFLYIATLLQLSMTVRLSITFIITVYFGLRLISFIKPRSERLYI